MGGHIENGQLVAKVNYFGCIELLDGFKSVLEKSNGRVVVISSNSAQMRTDPENVIIKHLLEENETKAMEEIGDAHGAQIYALSKHAVARAIRRRSPAMGPSRDYIKCNSSWANRNTYVSRGCRSSRNR